MESVPKNIWKRLSGLFPTNPEQSTLAAELFREYEVHGFLRRHSGDMLSLDRPVVVDFYRRVALMHSAESPILRRRDTRWMSEFDYTLMNVRAAGAARTGTFFSAAAFLPLVRTRGLVLAPLTQGPDDRLNVLGSHARLRDELVDPVLLEAGVSPETQLAAFCEAAHLMGLVLGFDSDYRVHPMAAVVVNRPELFFWMVRGVFDADDAWQDACRARVRELVDAARDARGGLGRGAVERALDEAGMVPLGAWDGSARTPLAMHRPSAGGSPKIREEAVQYWGRIFDHWRDRYGFDFLILRGTGALPDGAEAAWGESGVVSRPLEGEKGIGPRELVLPDWPVIQHAADAARKGGVRRNVGVAAEGTPHQVERFGLHGVDLVVPVAEEDRADQKWFNDTFALDKQLQQINLGRKLRFSVMSRVDPGETESKPRRERALIKRFVARFLGAGPARRPLLETMGALEGAWGFGRAMDNCQNMGWVSDPVTMTRAHCIEDVALRYQEIMEKGRLRYRHLERTVAWWVIQSRKGLLLAVSSVENEDLLAPEPFTLNYSSFLDSDILCSVLEFDFQESRGNLRLTANTEIMVARIPYRGFRLYAIA